MSIVSYLSFKIFKDKYKSLFTSLMFKFIINTFIIMRICYRKEFNFIIDINNFKIENFVFYYT